MGARAGKFRIKAGHGQRARGNGVPDGGATAPDVPVAVPYEHEAPPNGHAAAAGPVTGPESNGSSAGAGQRGADGPGVPGSVPGGPGGRRGGAGRSSLKNWRVRSRLLLLIAIPTVTALVLGGVRIASATQSALAFQRAEERAVLAADVTQLAQRLETERDQTIYFIALGIGSGRPGYLIPPPPPPASKSAAAIKKHAAAIKQYNSQRAPAVQQYKVIQAFYRQTDQGIANFRALLARYHNAYASAAEQRVSSAVAGLDDLRYLRYASTRTQLYPLVVVNKYADLIDNLLVIDDQTAQGTGDPVLSQTVGVLGLVSRMKEEASEQRAILAAALLQGSLTQVEVSALDTAQANQASGLQAFNLSATAAQRERWDNTVSGSFVYLAPSQEQQAETLQATNHSLGGDTITAAGFYDAMTSGIGQMGSVERLLANDVINQANALRKSAVTSAILVGIAVLLLFGLALLFTVMVVRSMVRPLRRLRAGALEVARVRLPETVRRMSEGEGASVPSDVAPIAVDSTDEIGEVARAFDQVHREAVRLASNEAALRGNVNAMFVNLSRRSQSLVERQIRLIDDLEQGEQDSERLANLFQMDHLATRMRRNSENLLVLAGHEVSRRRTQSVGLVDVLRAAVSEIEQYERVTLNVQPGIAVRVHAANDVVHLLAELAENATSFSAAETPVAVSGHLLNSGGVLLDISDQGVGMGAEEMAHANWRLDNPPVVDVAVSRRMGLFVVARLAARHGIRVRLRPASMGGLTALVWLPDEVIAHETAGFTAGFRRLDPTALDDPALADPSLGDPRLDDPGSGGRWAGALAQSGDPAAGAGLPGRHASDPEFADEVRPAAELATASVGAIVPPGASPAAQSRLPIFESVESDWFRRSRQGSDVPDSGTPTEAWSSPADEGWRAAEVAQAPVSDGLTAAGLPQRVPKANLVPGRAVAPGAASQPVALRSAAQTQERLASFQRAVREARAAAQADGGAEQGEEGSDQAD